MSDDFISLTSQAQIQFELDLDLFCLLNIDIQDEPRLIGITQRQNWKPSYIHSAFIEQLQQQFTIERE